MEHRYRRHTTARIALLALSVAVLLTVGGITATVHADTGNARIQLFTQNRQLWERGDDIRALQAFLNVNNFTLALVGAGSPGHEVVLFGPRTLRALKAFQAAHALPTTGYFGPLTRAVINLSVAQKFLSQFAPAKATSALGATSSPPVTATSTLAETLPVRHLSGGSSTSPTTPSDTTAPVLSAGSPSGTLTVGTNNTTLSLTTDEAATCNYSTSSGTAFASMAAFTTTGNIAHSTSITGLVNGGSYVYYVKCQDTSGNTNSNDYTISFTVAADLTSPTASVTAPSNNATVTGSAVAVSANAADDVSVAGRAVQAGHEYEHWRGGYVIPLLRDLELDRRLRWLAYHYRGCA